MSPPSSRRSRGYILLAVMLVIAALVLLVALSQQRAGDEGTTANLERSHAQAQALAEMGLARTRAYLGGLLEREVDLDRALDPGLDTDCTTLPSPGPVTLDDHLPSFADGKPVTDPSSGKVYWRVPGDDNADGAYFVRIDDNDDDAQDSSTLAVATTNNLMKNCVEGPSLGPLRNNPVRDRDGMVWVTVIGVHPGTRLDGNAAHATLRVLVGPGEPAGIIAGGTVKMLGAAHVCGRFGDVVATGSIEGGCLCGSACSSGPPWNMCPTSEACIALSAGARCTATAGRPTEGDECSAGVSVPPPPRVSAWDVTQAPLGCSGAPCLPFYYLRMEDRAKLYGWSYEACPSPRSKDRICTPSECAPCWVLLDATPVKKPLEIHLSDTDPGLRAQTPVVTLSADKTPRVWLSNGTTGAISGGPGCDADDTGLYPGGPGLGRRDVPNATFDYLPTGSAERLPRGIWLVEGNVRFPRFDTPDCVALGAEPGYGVSIIATGNISHEAGALSLPPAGPKGVVMLAGRDLSVQGGSARLFTCDASAVVMVHEQAVLAGDAHLEAQLVVENASSCSAALSGDALQMSDTATVSVPRMPPLPVGPPVRVRLFSESTH